MELVVENFLTYSVEEILTLLEWNSMFSLNLNFLLLWGLSRCVGYFLQEMVKKNIMLWTQYAVGKNNQFKWKTVENFSTIFSAEMFTFVERNSILSFNIKLRIFSHFINFRYLILIENMILKCKKSNEKQIWIQVVSRKYSFRPKSLNLINRFFTSL